MFVFGDSALFVQAITVYGSFAARADDGRALNRPMSQQLSAIRFLRIMGFLEGLSNVVLFCIAMPVKYGLGIKEAVKYPGWVHGILFVCLLYTSPSPRD